MVYRDDRLGGLKSVKWLELTTEIWSIYKMIGVVLFQLTSPINKGNYIFDE